MSGSMKHGMSRRMAVCGFLSCLGFWIVARSERGHAVVSYVWGRLRGGFSIQERVRMHGADVEKRLKPKFLAAGVSFPPSELAWIAFKDSAQLCVYARSNASGSWRWIHTYPILGMSGTTGPKLRQGDRQVPEGMYRAESLNPNSRFHLSIRLNYPNEFDRIQAKADGRTDLGSDIMIHGTTASVGCLAMGNQAAEDLFVLAAHTGKDKVEILVSPVDFRVQDLKPPLGSPSWINDLYGQLRTNLDRFPGTVVHVP